MPTAALACPLEPLLLKAGLGPESLASWPGPCAEMHLELLLLRLNSAPGGLDKRCERAGDRSSRAGGQACVRCMGER